MTTKSKTNLLKQLAKKNAEFERLTPRQKFVAICEDALAQVEAGVYAPSCGVYVEFSQGIVSDLTTSQSLQVTLLDKQPACTCCVRGAMLLSRARLGNSISGVDINNPNRHTWVPGIPIAIQVIAEVLFEGYDINEFLSEYASVKAGLTRNNRELVKKEANRLYLKYFGSSKKSEKDLMTVILKNFIRNRGNYRLPNDTYLIPKELWKSKLPYPLEKDPE